MLFWPPTKPAHRNLVAGLQHRVFPLRVERRVDLGEEFVGGFGRLLVRAVVHVLADRDQLLELGHAAVMVAVPVGDDQAIDLGEAGIFRGGEDAAGVADRAVGVAGIDQQRLACRVHEQRRVAAFDVDDIDVETRARALGARGRGGQAEKRGTEQ